MRNTVKFYFIAISEWLQGRPWWYAKEIAEKADGWL